MNEITTNPYLDMDIEQLQSTIDQLNAASPRNNDAIQAATAALAQKVSQQSDVAAEDAFRQVDSMEIAGFSLREMCIDEPSYQFVSVAIKQQISTLAAKYIGDLTAQKASYEQKLTDFSGMISTLRSQIDHLQTELATAQATSAEHEKSANTLKFERDEALKVRDNAAAEIDRLKAELASKAETVVVDQTEQMKKAREEYLASRIKITNLRKEDPQKENIWLAELVQDGPTGEDPKYGRVGETGKAGDTIRIYFWSKGKYSELSAAEAEQFRAEHPVPNQPLDDGQATHVDIPKVDTDFRTPSAGSTSAEVSGATDNAAAGTVASGTVEERLAALEQRVSALELTAKGAA